MDPSLLEKPSFWEDPAVCAPGGAPGNATLEAVPPGHVLFQTSGSTGRPKWIALSKPALLASAGAVNRHLEVTADTCWGLALPPHHVGGFGVAARAFEARARLAVLPGRWNATACREWLARDGVTHLSLVPAQVHDLVTTGLAAPPGLRAVIVGGGRLDEAAGRAARALGWPVLASYGMTEAGSQIATQKLELLNTPYQAAPIPLLPVWQARTDAGGLLEISGAPLFSGTLDPEGYTPREHPWHPTSDLVRLDGRLLTPIGRTDTRVKVLGELVDPLEIEAALVALSDHKLAPGAFAVIAVADPRTEHALVPVFEGDTPRELINDILAHHHAAAPGYQRLRPPVVLPELPRGPLGKIRRAAIAGLLDPGKRESS